VVLIKTLSAKAHRKSKINAASFSGSPLARVCFFACYLTHPGALGEQLLNTILDEPVVAKTAECGNSDLHFRP
jgi:hypothetical protein